MYINYFLNNPLYTELKNTDWAEAALVVVRTNHGTRIPYRFLAQEIQHMYTTGILKTRKYHMVFT